jgi:hypothetical protein
MGGFPYAFLYPGHSLSSIHVNGVSQYYGSADSAVFGFKYDRPEHVDTGAMRTLYVTTPAARSTSELASRAVTRKADAATLAKLASAEDWEGQRKAYWASMKGARV